ncbi:MAG: C_GCAxxG_C_C family protein [Candidatus Latescibacteria bacterium]|jgi:hypothetical protein|nr:C_GCAxxG_C_C family protein [Candidatus Latescibacterota bacterium]
MERTDEVHIEKKIFKFRRKFIYTAAVAGLSGLFMKEVEGASKKMKKNKILDRNDRFDIGGGGEEIINKSYDLGYMYEKNHGGCARCSVGALQDSIDFIPENKSILRGASCLDGGATPTKKANCGAFTGCGMVIGELCGTDTYGDTSLSHELILKLHTKFEQEHGGVLCSEVRESMDADCPEVVGLAVKWTAEILLKQFTNYT